MKTHTTIIHQPDGTTETLTAKTKKQHDENLFDACAKLAGAGEVHQTCYGAAHWAVWRYNPNNCKAYRTGSYPKDPQQLKLERGY